MRDASYLCQTLLQRLNCALNKWWYSIRWNSSADRDINPTEAQEYFSCYRLWLATTNFVNFQMWMEREMKKTSNKHFIVCTMHVRAKICRRTSSIPPLSSLQSVSEIMRRKFKKQASKYDKQIFFFFLLVFLFENFHFSQSKKSIWKSVVICQLSEHCT